MADTSPFLAGIHFFCDHRCWRCPMTHRCRVWARVADGPGSRAPDGGGPMARVAAVTMAAMHVTVDEVSEIVQALAANGLTESDVTEDLAAPSAPAVRISAERDSLVLRAKDYARGAMRVVQALRPRAVHLDDRVALDALDRLEETCLTIASKIHRATCNWNPEAEPRESPQDDAHGSAKVALLLIAESVAAWQVVGAPGRSFGNGAPARFAVVLEALEAGVLDRFPQAPSFVRPGFDTEARDADTLLLARALNAPSAQGSV